jgi:hypothetical protein
VQPIVLRQHKLSLRADILTLRPYGLAKPRLHASPDYNPRLNYLNERRSLVSLSLNTIMWPFRSVAARVICGTPLAFLSPSPCSAGENLHDYDTIDHSWGERSFVHSNRAQTLESRSTSTPYSRVNIDRSPIASMKFVGLRRTATRSVPATGTKSSIIAKPAAQTVASACSSLQGGQS